MRALLCVIALLSLAACQGTPEHRLTFRSDEAGRLTATSITEDSRTTIAVENTGREPVIVEALSLQEGWGGVLSIDEVASGCAPGLTLGVNQRCIISVAFEPGNDITYLDWLHIDYRPEEGGGVPLRATLSVRGVGVLDCSLREDFASSYETGVSNAEARMATDVVEAAAAAAALTAEDGYADGYAATYDDAYDRAYGPAYELGRTQGYDDGFADGASALACDEGQLDGYADGSGAGRQDGEVDGFEDGAAAGYDAGFADGLYDGETDGCGFAEKVDLDPSLPGKCVDQGHAATYSRGPYNRAYAEALAENTLYLEGVSLGESEGANAGAATGDADGYAIGYRDGAELGFVDGDADQYEACYLDAEEVGYEDGYLDAYDAFFDAAAEEAYPIGYNDGYASGLLVCA